MTRTHIYAACLAFLILTLAIAGMGYRAKTDIEALVTDQFNRQQLLLAEKIAADITDHFAFLRVCQQSLSRLWCSGDAQNGPCPTSPVFAAIFAEWNVAALGLLRPGAGEPAFVTPDGRSLADARLCDTDCRKRLADPEQAGKITTSRVFSPDGGPLAGRLLLTMILPLADGTGAMGGLVLIVDARAVAARYAHAVRSGETGYAWVVDGTGRFLDHHEAAFVGRDSLEVRRERGPDIDWTRLAELLRTRMLPGERGMDWYVSGWHRTRLGLVRKLVAFCPVALSGDGDPANRWVVALAAPEDEVQGLIGRLLVREWLLVGLLELVVFAGFVLTLHLALRWSTSLSREADRMARELFSAKEKLLRAERFAAIGEAAARLSHEIKNPLTLMGGFASQVRRHLPRGGADFEKLGIVEAEARRLEVLLNEVRDFTRPAPPQIEPGDLNATVEASVALVAEGMRARAIRMELVLERDLPPVPHDPSRIKQVLLNLLKNAAEAMGQGGTVTIGTRRVADRVHIEIADTGGGIPQELRDRVFDPFYTTKESGTGLGLTVCQRIVTDHHGEISHAATAEGAVFTVALPLA